MQGQPEAAHAHALQVIEEYGELFLFLFLPSAINWLVPAALMYRAIPVDKPAPQAGRVVAKPGMGGVAVLFALSIATAVGFKNFLSLPPAMGMMLGLGYLQMYSYWLGLCCGRKQDEDMILDSFAQVQRVDWDALLFFFGIIFSVGGLGVLGYLGVAAEVLYVGLGATSANIILGLLSAVVDNIPLIFAVLITLTCGVGGLILSVGSAAAILCHLWLNAALF